MPDRLTNPCPLCENQSVVFYQNSNQLFHQCSICYGIFIDQSLLPTLGEEQNRYETHNNDVDDLNYQKFVSPITSTILENHTSDEVGLDFGAGTGPVISKVLLDNNFSIEQYDPIFHNYPKLLDKKYNYIACCEVIEHFHHPRNEFKLLNSLLKKNGRLYCMTHIYDESIDFTNWYYKNDPTHVFIYTKQTICWIKDLLCFSDVELTDRLITFCN